MPYAATRGTRSSGGWVLTGREGEGPKGVLSAGELRFVAISCPVPGEQARYPASSENLREHLDDGR